MHVVILLLERQDDIEKTVAPGAHQLQRPAQLTQGIPRPAQGGAHGRTHVRHQTGCGLFRIHVDIEHQHANKHARCVAIATPRPVQRRHSHKDPVAHTDAAKIQGECSQKIVESAQATLGRHANHLVVLGTYQRLGHCVCGRRSVALRIGKTALDQWCR